MAYIEKFFFFVNISKFKIISIEKKTQKPGDNWERKITVPINRCFKTYGKIFTDFENRSFNDIDLNSFYRVFSSRTL